MSSRVFRAQRVLLPDGERAATVHVAGGRIVRIGAHDDVVAGIEIVDAPAGAVLIPGIVDTHVHVNEPGRTEWEGFETATRAAAAGGVTTIVDMPLNSIPPATSQRGVAEKAALTEGRVVVDIGLWGGAVPENTTGDPRGMKKILEEGARGFKCFLVPSGVDEFPNVDEADLEAALRQLRDSGVALMAHAEVAGPIDAATAAMAQEEPPADPRAYATYLRSRPPAAEDEAVELLYRLCKKTGTPVHVVHLGSAGALQTLRRARDEGVPLSAETAPHYLTFLAEEIPDGATWFKCAPPIRDRAHRELLWDGLREGLIRMVVSDHSPCIPDLKKVEEGDFMGAWGGISGLQFGFASVWTEARARGIPLADVIAWMSAAPAAHAGLGDAKGGIVAGRDADLVFFDPDASFTVETGRIEHRNKLTPYEGRTLHGVVRSTWLRGERVFDGKVFDGKPSGKWLRWDRR